MPVRRAPPSTPEVRVAVEPPFGGGVDSAAATLGAGDGDAVGGGGVGVGVGVRVRVGVAEGVRVFVGVPVFVAVDVGVAGSGAEYVRNAKSLTSAMFEVPWAYWSLSCVFPSHATGPALASSITYGCSGTTGMVDAKSACANA